MEHSSLYNASEIEFLKIFHKILLSFLAVVIALVYSLSLNDTVSFDKGEIIPKNPEKEYRAPFEAVPTSIGVKEGDSLSKGDTLMVLKNDELLRELSNAENMEKFYNEMLQSIHVSIQNIEHKMNLLYQEKGIESSKYETIIKKHHLKLTSNQEKDRLVEEKFKLAQEKLKTDSTLFEEEAISLRELKSSYKEYLEIKNDYLEIKKEYQESKLGEVEIKEEFLSFENRHRTKLTELINQKENLLQQKFEMKKNRQEAKAKITFTRKQLSKLYIISDTDGFLINAYNVKQDYNYVYKGDRLAVVAPKQKQFYTKVFVPEKDLKYVKVGQWVNLKLDAYYHYENGELKGKVAYISEHKTKEGFYILIDIQNPDHFDLKSGYKLNGDIIVEELKLYQFIIKTIFRKWDKMNEPMKKTK